MVAKTKKNPFVPGRGLSPPYLAGRAQEQAALRNQLDYLTPTSGAPGEVVLVGPRGNGKTVLMRWYQRQILATGVTDAVWLTPDDMPDLDKLANSLAPPHRFDSLLPNALSFSIGAGQMGWELGGQAKSLTDLLVARCTHQPLVVLLDEAHTLDPTVGQVLLNTSQKVCQVAPFLLVMAGTPALREHLNTLSATFWNRCEKLSIGRLDADATRKALTIPLAQDGISLAEDALNAVVEDSQYYPYFIQLWGQALWREAQDNDCSRLESPQGAAYAAVARARGAYYVDRYFELEGRGVLNAATALAAAFVGRANLTNHQIKHVLAEELGQPLRGLDAPPGVLTVRNTLQALGYIWARSDKDDWEPGIPSLMDYVVQKSQRG